MKLGYYFLKRVSGGNIYDDIVLFKEDQEHFRCDPGTWYIPAVFSFNYKTNQWMKVKEIMPRLCRDQDLKGPIDIEKFMSENFELFL